MIRKQLPFLVFLLFGITCHLFSQNDTISLYYKIGVSKINRLNYNKIQEKLDNLQPNKSYQVEIISSADFLGSTTSNSILSKNRANTVRDLLVIKNNIQIASIKYDGIGEINTIKTENKKGISSHRKTIVIFKEKVSMEAKVDNVTEDPIFKNIINAKSGEKFILQDIIFEPGSHLFKKKSLKILKKLVLALEENSNLQIELSGHVCCGKNNSELIDGYDKITETFNLSANRAKHIYNYLVLKKIDKSRLSHKGYGFQKPLVFPELTNDDRNNNRRVEIKIIKN